jgi:hypothetical protein
MKTTDQSSKTASDRPVPQIRFPGGAAWGAYNQAAMMRFASRPATGPLAVRILFAALGRHDRAGHARFAPNELAQLFEWVDTETGELRPRRADSISQAIAAAKEALFIGPESTARCLVLSSTDFQKARGRIESCVVHGT